MANKTERSANNQTKGLFRGITYSGIVALVCVLGIWLAKDNIALFLFQQNIEKLVGWDLRDDLEEGLHVAFCGTGSPLPDPGRGGACTAVIAGKQVFLFDAGEGSAESLALMGILPSDVEKVFLTHFHSDHINGLGALALQHVFRGGVSTPLPVYGGPGIERVIAGFNEAYAMDHICRVRHHGTEVAPAAGFELLAMPIETPTVGNVLVLDSEGVTIEAFRVNHISVEPAYGYRVNYAGRSVVISGDTAYSANLAVAAKGADLLVHEALAPALVSLLESTSIRHNRTGLATVMRDIPEYHASPADAARTATQAGVTALALTHLIPGLPGTFFDDLFLEGAEDSFDGPLWIMRDGDVISLPSAGGIHF